jgi:hypothetical protein
VDAWRSRVIQRRDAAPAVRRVFTITGRYSPLTRVVPHTQMMFSDPVIIVTGFTETRLVIAAYGRSCRFDSSLPQIGILPEPITRHISMTRCS